MRITLILIRYISMSYINRRSYIKMKIIQTIFKYKTIIFFSIFCIYIHRIQYLYGTGYILYRLPYPHANKTKPEKPHIPHRHKHTNE